MTSADPATLAPVPVVSHHAMKASMLPWDAPLSLTNAKRIAATLYNSSLANNPPAPPQQHR